VLKLIKFTDDLSGEEIQLQTSLSPNLFPSTTSVLSAPAQGNLHLCFFLLDRSSLSISGPSFNTTLFLALALLHNRLGSSSTTS